MKTVIDRIIASKVQSVCEWDDRTSPDDYPLHLLILPEELSAILREAIQESVKASIDIARMSILEEAYLLGFDASEEDYNSEDSHYHKPEEWEARRRKSLIEMCERLSLRHPDGA